MRMTQLQGLPESALKFLEKNAIVLNLCHTCGRNDGYKHQKMRNIGMFNGDAQLKCYTLIDGTFAEEFVQHEYWDSGPVIFLGLKVISTGKEFLWDQSTWEEIDPKQEIDMDK